MCFFFYHPVDFFIFYVVWFLGVHNESLLVDGCTGMVNESGELVNDSIIADNDRPVDTESEAFFAVVSFPEACVADGCTDKASGLAAAEDKHKFADEKIKLETGKSESTDLLNDSRNDNGLDSACEDDDVDRMPAEQDGITTSVECSSSPSRVDAVNDVVESDGVAEGSGPNDNGPSCTDPTKVSLLTSFLGRR